jgi:hypothetical protein
MWLNVAYQSLDVSILLLYMLKINKENGNI